MIYDKIAHASRYKFTSLSLMKALESIASNNNDPEELEYFKKNIIEFHTSSIDLKQAEYHHKFMDIHVVLEGKEYVEVGHIDELSNCSEFDESSDIGFGDLLTLEKFSGYLMPGYFLVCFPEDAHLVGAYVTESEYVKKIVYKILIN
ncbi:YhcH/YjgK/YiaL family protein [Paenibacillus endoradicis]|uniref:YhcH/YjgK/YiaL family protein n=1 Tax=Paenibacillus endoradicis TaxID=2972487 RepID=UPI00215958CA|nr:YhcH/YjgK/YiaL family protein [Paenibacillus endoradicis]MCR8660611.1 YhcH/YjgK/YiaL family protein [Paenibacillus endoradicis]